MDPDDGELSAIRRLWPRIVSQQDQTLALCRQWVADAPDGQVAGLWLAVQDTREIRALDDESLMVLRHMALVGLYAAIESAIMGEQA